ncbi:MAG: hypothetical protein NWR72_20340 [Bacteroidia bacterium]|nr:hypothetical protein [Bacteroidia bacterium]
MKWISLVFLLLASLSGYAQKFVATSLPVKMDFGYPVLEDMDDVTYIDDNNNNIIDPGEGALITFTLKNTGKWTARNVQIRPEELNGINGIEIDKVIDIGDIQPGESKDVSIGVYANRSLSRGTASFIFYIDENGSYNNVSVVYGVDTNR